MRHYFLTLCFCLSMPLAAKASFLDDDTQAPCIAGAQATFEVGFSDSNSLSVTLVKEIASAKKSIRIAARDFVSKPLSEAVVKASRRDVDVKIVLNKKTNSNVNSAAQFLATMSMPPHETKSEDRLYSDYMIIDERDVVTGNIAALMDSDEEKKDSAGVLVVHNVPDLAKQYLQNWQPLWDASVEVKKISE